MIEATIIGAGIVAFISAYMFFKLGENTGKEHIVLQLLIFSILVGSVVVIGGATFKATNCDMVQTNTTTQEITSSSNQTDSITYHNYEYQCQEEPFGISDTFLKLTQWFYRLSLTYLIIYFIYKVLLAIGVDLVENIKNRFK